MQTRTQHRRRLAALAVVAAVLVAACGGDDSGADPTTSPSVTSAPSEPTDQTEPGPSTSAGGGSDWVATVEGCEGHGVTDPADRSLEREPARCAPGTPAPQPLPEHTKVVVSSAFSLEFMSPILLAQSLGEFEKENLEIEMVNVSYADAVPQLAQGSIDAAVGGSEIALFNAGHQGLPVRAVLGNYYPPDAGNYDVPQTGLWCRSDSFSDPANPDPAETQQLVWASSVGKGSSSIWYSSTELGRRVPGFDIDSVEVQQIPSAEILVALRNDAVDCGILLDPIWLELADDPDYVMMATQTPGEPLGQVSFGKSLLEDHPEVGEAFVRAYIRTVNTYYDGDYHADAEVMSEIAEQTGVEIERMTQVASLVFDWEIRDGTVAEMQQFFIDVGVITQFDSPVPDSDIVDRSFYLKAVGAI